MERGAAEVVAYVFHEMTFATIVIKALLICLAFFIILTSDVTIHYAHRAAKNTVYRPVYRDPSKRAKFSKELPTLMKTMTSVITFMMTMTSVITFMITMTTFIDTIRSHSASDSLSNLTVTATILFDLLCNVVPLLLSAFQIMLRLMYIVMIVLFSEGLYQYTGVGIYMFCQLTRHGSKLMSTVGYKGSLIMYLQLVIESHSYAQSFFIVMY